MAGAHKFTELKFWQLAREWSKQIFQQTQDENFKTDRRLIIQINDWSESVMANIAEDDGCLYSIHDTARQRCQTHPQNQELVR